MEEKERLLSWVLVNKVGGCESLAGRRPNYGSYRVREKNSLKCSSSCIEIKVEPGTFELLRLYG